MTGWVIVGNRLKDFFVSQSLDIHSCHSVPPFILTLLFHSLFSLFVFCSHPRRKKIIATIWCIFLFDQEHPLWDVSHISGDVIPQEAETEWGTLWWCFKKKKNHTLNSVLVVHFIHIKLLFLFMVNNTTNALISVDVHVCTIALPLLPSRFYPLSLSVPHCQCREHSHSYRP